MEPIDLDNLDELTDLRDCKTAFDLAKLLNLKINDLFFFAYNNNNLYTHYKINKKSGGERDISAPIEALKSTCKKIAVFLDKIYDESLPLASHGFVVNRSIVTNAKNHLNKKYILNIDIENFFGNINSGRVMGLLKKYPFNLNTQLASIVTGIATHKNSLPQGSPSSPVISNMICLRLDKEFTKLAHRNGWVYSRYADDITISSNILTDELASVNSKKETIVGKSIIKIIEKNGFRINKKKVRLALPNQSKWVTGIKINEELNVSRSYIRQVRSMIFVLEKKLIRDKRQLLEYNDLVDIVRGKVSHIGNVKSKENITYIKLHNRVCELENKSYRRRPESLRETYKEKVLVIKTSKGFGSGFFINKNLIITAAHLLNRDEKYVQITTRQRKLAVEFKTANVLSIDNDKDLAILYTNSSDFSGATFGVDYSGRNYDHDTRYISVGYGGFRSNQTFWSDVCIVDQKIAQINGGHNFTVTNAMWGGMSGGPVISEKSNLVVGYIVRGSSSLESSNDVKSFIFYPMTNVPNQYRQSKGTKKDLGTIEF